MCQVTLPSDGAIDGAKWRCQVTVPSDGAKWQCQVTPPASSSDVASIRPPVIRWHRPSGSWGTVATLLSDDTLLSDVRWHSNDKLLSENKLLSDDKFRWHNTLRWHITVRWNTHMTHYSWMMHYCHCCQTTHYCHMTHCCQMKYSDDPLVTDKTLGVHTQMTHLSDQDHSQTHTCVSRLRLWHLGLQTARWLRPAESWNKVLTFESCVYSVNCSSESSVYNVKYSLSCPQWLSDLAVEWSRLIQTDRLVVHQLRWLEEVSKLGALMEVHESRTSHRSEEVKLSTHQSLAMFAPASLLNAQPKGNNPKKSCFLLVCITFKG